jgi:hypothetical protein
MGGEVVVVRRTLQRHGVIRLGSKDFLIVMFLPPNPLKVKQIKI